MRLNYNIFLFLFSMYPFVIIAEEYGTPQVANQPIFGDEPLAAQKKMTMPRHWLVKSALENAPDYIKGIINYLKMYDAGTVIPSLHRLILVGPPGSGKTTLALAIGRLFAKDMRFVPVCNIIGHYRNLTAERLTNFFKEATADSAKKVIIIDELDKIFENYNNDKSDDSMTASAFWLALDEIEKMHPHIFFIGIMNDASKLPPQIKSRFHGKIITIDAPNKQQRLEAFKNILRSDQTIMLENNLDDTFILSLLSKLKNCSMRDVQLLIDTAKVVKLSDLDLLQSSQRILQLEKRHFTHALTIILRENKFWEENFFFKNYDKIQKISTIVFFALNSYHLTRLLFTGLQLTYHYSKLCFSKNWMSNVKNNQT